MVSQTTVGTSSRCGFDQVSDNIRTRGSHLQCSGGDTQKDVRLSDLFGCGSLRWGSGRENTVLWGRERYHADGGDLSVWRKSMNVLVSGATGFIGSALIPELEGLGHGVIRLSRSRPSAEDTIRWDPASGVLDPSRLRGLDAVVHLAAESVGEGRWTPAKKRRIMDSRREGTRLLAETIAGLSEPPGVMVSVSGINYYGSRGNELLREDSGPGNSFLARVCQEWERAADPARSAGVRVVHPRFGIVFPQGFSRDLLCIKARIEHPRFEITFGTSNATFARLQAYGGRVDLVGQAVLALARRRGCGVFDPPRSYHRDLARSYQRSVGFRNCPRIHCDPESDLESPDRLPATRSHSPTGPGGFR